MNPDLVHSHDITMPTTALQNASGAMEDVLAAAVQTRPGPGAGTDLTWISENINRLLQQ